jgi:hypothetical protein
MQIPMLAFVPIAAEAVLIYPATASDVVVEVFACSAEQLPVQIRSYTVMSAHTIMMWHQQGPAMKRCIAFVSLMSVPTEVLQGTWYVLLATAAAHMHTMCMQFSTCRV